MTDTSYFELARLAEADPLKFEQAAIDAADERPELGRIMLAFIDEVAYGRRGDDVEHAGEVAERLRAIFDPARTIEQLTMDRVPSEETDGAVVYALAMLVRQLTARVEALEVVR